MQKSSLHGRRAVHEKVYFLVANKSLATACGVCSSNNILAAAAANHLHGLQQVAAIRRMNVSVYIADVFDKSQLQRANAQAMQPPLDRQHSSSAFSRMSVCITCPDEVADVVANNDGTVTRMPRAEALAAINFPCRADSIDRHTKHGRSALPVSIWLALLKEVWPKSPRCHPEQPQSIHTAAHIAKPLADALVLKL